MPKSQDEALALLEAMPDKHRKEAISEAKKLTGNLRWLPSPGPQTDAYFSKADVLLFGGEPGGGKAVHTTTRIPTPYGWTTMGELQVGDQVFDEQGVPCNVVAKTLVFLPDEAYRVMFSDGSYVDVDANHEWVTRSRRERLRAWGSSDERRAVRRANRPSRVSGKKSAKFTTAISARNSALACTKGLPLSGTRTTREIADTLCIGTDRRVNHSIDMARPLQLPDADLLVDPYVLGAWLGDGSANCGQIAGLDEGVFAQVANHYVVTRLTRPDARGTIGLHTHLRQLGVLNNKHIPPAYLRGSVDQRLSLLQGLMDTDGYCDSRGQCEIQLTRKDLIDGVHELLSSLGIKAQMREGVAKLYGRTISPKWRLKFQTNMPAFRLPRKLIKQKRDTFRGTHDVRYITSCEKIAPVPMQCIQVDSPSHCYLVGRSMIPTHNSSLILGLAFNEHERSLIVRRRYTDLSGLIDEALKINGGRQGFNGSVPPTLRFEGNKLIEFGACHRVGDEEFWQGRPHDLICVGRGTPVLMADGTYKAVEKLTVGERVQTLEGPKRITKVFPVQKKQAVRMRVKDASGVIAEQIQSAVHEVFAPEGWVCPGSIVSAPQVLSFAPRLFQVCRTVAGLYSETCDRFLPFRAAIRDCLERIGESVQSPPLLAHPFGLGTFAFAGQRVQGSGSEGFDDSSREVSQPQVSNVLQAHYGQSHQSIHVSQPVSRSSLSSDVNDVLRMSLPEDSTDDCSAYCCQYGEHTHEYEDSCASQVVGQLYLHQPIGVEQSIPIHCNQDVLGKTPRYTLHKATYVHPYTKDIRPTTELLRKAAFDVVPVGEMELFDFCVEEVNHYITKGGIVNKNCFDEGTQLAYQQIRFLMGWLRSTNPDQRKRVIIASNPPLSAEGIWVVQMFAPWLDDRHPNPAKPGELRWFVTDEDGNDKEVDGPSPVDMNGKMVMPLSRTFIPSSVQDNPYLRDTGYQSQLDSMIEPYRSILMGHFKQSLSDQNNQVIPTAWIRAAMERWKPTPPEGVPMCAMAVDVSGGGKDPMIFAMRYDGWYDKLISVPASSIPQDRAGAYSAGLVMGYRKNLCPVVVDLGGGYGGSLYEHLKNNDVDTKAYRGMDISQRRTQDKQLKFVSKRAAAYWQFREALDPQQSGGSPVSLPKDPVLLADLTAPTFEITPNGIRVEAKEDIIARLGRSTDRGDAVVMAWSEGPRYATHAMEWMDERFTFKAEKKFQPRVITGRRMPLTVGRRR